MKTIRRLTVLMGFVAALVFGASHLSAAPFLVNQGPPVWCFGLNDLDQCVLFLGTEATCANVSPCSAGLVSMPDLNFCFGANEFDECVLFLGTREQCDNLNPCVGGAGQFPRVPKSRVDRAN
jgi:hypothetical protein